MRLLLLTLLGLIAFGNGSRAEEALISKGAEGFGYELVLAKMDYLEQRLLELQTENKEQKDMLHQLLKQNSDILDQQKICSNQNKVSNQEPSVEQLNRPSDDGSETQSTTNNDEDTNIESCSDEKAKTSGRYKLKISNKTIEVYCEQQLHGTGWILIQNRFDGSVSFDRNWTEYRNGFGSLEGEFWLGLENIHIITSSKQHELLVHLEDFQGTVKHITYEQFSIGNERDKYPLQISKNYKGSLGDSLADYHGGSKFSTPDENNDTSAKEKCSQQYRSGWWFKECYWSNLNGQYQTNGDGIEWYKFANSRAHMKISKMMIRAK